LDDSKDLGVWWGHVVAHSRTNLLVFIVNGTNVRDSNRKNLTNVMEFATRMEYRIMYLWTWEIPEEMPSFIKLEVGMSYKLLAPKKTLSPGDKESITVSMLRDILKTSDWNKNFHFISPVQVFDLFKQYRNSIGKLLDKFALIQIRFKDAHQVFGQIKKRMDQMLDLVLKCKQQLESGGRVLETNKLNALQKLQRAETELKTFVDNIDKVRSKFVDQNGDGTEKRVDSAAHHAYSWLPFVGNIKLERIRELQNYCANKFLQYEPLKLSINNAGDAIKVVSLDVVLGQHERNAMSDIVGAEKDIKQNIFKLTTVLTDVKQLSDDIQAQVKELQGYHLL